jgi:hypothetical protein
MRIAMITAAITSLCGAVVISPAWAQQREVSYYVDGDDPCVDYSSIAFAVATHGVDVANPYSEWSTDVLEAMDLVFVRKGKRTSVDAIWRGGAPENGDRFAVVDNESFPAYLGGDSWLYGYTPSSSGCPSPSGTCGRLCLIVLAPYSP